MSTSIPDSMYRALYEHSMDAVLLTAPDGSVFAANPAACEMFRMTESDICRLGRSGLVKDNAAFHAWLEEREREGRVRGELTYIRGDGSCFIGEVSSAQFTDDTGKLRTALIIHDLTKRKHMETALAASEKRYRSVVRSMGEGVVFQQADGRIIAVNPAAERILGHTAEELMGMTSADGSWNAIHEDGSPFPVPEHPISLALSHRKSQRDVVMGIRVGDELRWLSINAEPVFDEDDDSSWPKAAIATFHDITERKRADEAWRNSEQRYRMIFENSPVGLFRSTLDGRFIEANPALAHIYGYDTPEDLIREIHDIGKQLYVDEEDRQEVVARQAEAPGDSAIYLNRYRRRDGTECLANLYLKTIRDHEGKPVYFEGIVEDVTESKRAEDELRASEARFRIFVDHVADALFLHGEHGVILDANRQACLNLGYSREELIGMSPAEFDADLSPDARKTIDQRVRKGETVTFESHHRRKDGRIFPVEVSIRPFMDGERRVQVSSARDITERKRAKDELHASEARFRTFVDHAMDAFFVHDAEDGTVIDVNRQACLSLGYSQDELIGMNPSQFDAELSMDFRDIMRERVSQGEVMTFTSRHRRKDGSTFPVEVSVRTFLYKDRRLMISTARDISERLRVEGYLRRLNRELRAISHCHQALLRVDDQQGLLNEICRIICDEAGYRMAWVGFADWERQELKPQAWAGVDAGYLTHTKISWKEDTKYGQGPGAEAVTKGTIVYVQDIEADPRMEPWRQMALERGYQSCVAIPLKTDMKVFGALVMYAAERDTFVLEELRLLDELAEDLAFGIDVLRLRHEREQVKASLQASKEELKASNLQLRRLTARREDIREQERMDIARNVHDELGQLLTALKMKLSTLALGFGKENKSLNQEIESAQDLADQSLKAARDVISALRPSSLDMGLAVSLEWLAQRYTNDTGIPCDVHLSDWQDEVLNEAALIALYRIAQESLTNIARHAHAKQATIELKELEGTCQLVVRDNGCGFDPKRTKDDSFGLVGIQERVEMLGGAFAIDSKKGKGTELRVTIPVSIQQEAL